MKKLLLLIVAIIALQNVEAQNAYYDALFINKLSKIGLEKVLKADSIGLIDLSDQEVQQLKNMQFFLDDPFNLKDSIKTIFSVTPVRSAINKYNIGIQNESNSYNYNGFNGFNIGTGLGLITSAFSGDFSLSPEDQTKILDGLTKYYAEEFKKAQLLTYMQTFESTIGKVGELQVLFPNTYEKLKNTNPSKFPELGDEYKEIFSQDLRALIDNLIDHIDKHASSTKIGKYNFEIILKDYSQSQLDKRPKNRTKDSIIAKYFVVEQSASLDSSLFFLNGMNTLRIKDNEYYPSIRLSADISSKLVNNYHPVDLFNYLDAAYYNENYLTSDTNLDEKLGVIMHGVNLFQRNLLDTTKTKSGQFSNVWLNHEDFNKINTLSEWNYFVGLIYQQDKEFFKKIFFAPLTSTLSDSEIQSIKKTYTKILSSLNQIQEFRSNLNDDNLNENYIEYMKIALKVFQDITEIESFKKNFNYDISKFIKLSNYTLQVYDNARSKDYSNSIHYVTLILNEFLGANPTYLEIMQKVDKYGTFMTDVINSENSDEAKEVIKKHAAPPASFILKREYDKTFSITGQPGYFISAENLDNNWAFVSGITLPMGFEYTFKLKKGQENSASLGVFAQLVDLGAMLNFRVSDSSSTLPDEVKISNIFSPGVSLTYGFKNSPVTLGLGYQFTPELRKVTLENGNEIFPNGHRIFFRLAWDIPFINICKSKRK